MPTGTPSQPPSLYSFHAHYPSPSSLSLGPIRRRFGQRRWACASQANSGMAESPSPTTRPSSRSRGVDMQLMVAIIASRDWNYRLQPFHQPIWLLIHSAKPHLQPSISRFVLALACFLCNQSFKLRSEPNEDIFRGNDPEFILVTKNAFWWYILLRKIFLP